MTHSSARRFTAAIFALLLAFGTLLTIPVQATAQTTAPVAATTLSAQLAPSGDANGSGHAMLTLNENKRKVCATIHWVGIDAPESAHIHKRSDGSVVVDLTGAVTGGAKCTRGVARSTIRRILDRPGRYYVNVHNAAYPAGAIQGALRR